MRTRKVQSKIEPELEEHIKERPEYNGSFSDYIRVAIAQRSKFKLKKK